MTIPIVEFDQTIILASNNWYIKSFTDYMTHTFEPIDMFSISLFDTSTNIRTTYRPSDCTVTRKVNDNGTRNTFICTVNAVPSCKVVLQCSSNEKGIEFKSPVFLNQSTTNSLIGVEWPRVGILPIGESDNFYQTDSSWGGIIKKSPHTQFSTSAVPGYLQFLSYYDSVSQDTLYFWSNDEQFHAKVWGGRPQTTYVEYIMYHCADRHYDPGKVWRRNYSTFMEMFKANAVHGILAGYDSALRYREWTANPKRWWRSRGKWWESDRYSKIKDTDLHITMSLTDDTGTTIYEYNKITGEASKWTSLVNPYKAPLMTIYSWKNDPAHMHGSPDPEWDAPMLAHTHSGLAHLKENGWSTLLYTLHTEWDYANSRPGWKVTDYSGIDTTIPTNLSGYFMDLRGTGLQRHLFTADVGNPVALTYFTGNFPDWSFEMMHKNVSKDLVNRIYDLFETGSMPDGFYHDALIAVPVTAPFISSTGNVGDVSNGPNNTGFTYSQFHLGRSLMMKHSNDAISGQIGHSITATEWPSESNLPYVDFFYHHKHEFQTFGWPAGLLQVCHGDAVRFTDYGTPQLIYNDRPTTISVVNTYINQANLGWIRGGVFAFNDATELASDIYLVQDPITGGGLYYFLAWAQKVFTMQDQCMNYFKGYMTKPITADDWKIHAINQNTAYAGWQNFVATDYVNANTGYIMAETWKNSNNDLGTIITNTILSREVILDTDLAIFQAVTGSQPHIIENKPLFLHVSNEKDGLPDGVKIVYKSINGGQREEIARFTTAWSGMVTVPPWSVSLYEVVNVR